MGKYEKAILDFTKFIELKPDDERAYITRGSFYAKLEKYEKAILDYTKAINLKPDYETAYYNRGVVYDKLGKYEKAIFDYTKAINLKPDFTFAYYNRGVVYKKLGKYQEAIKDYSKVIELKPDYTKAYYYRGKLKYLYLNDKNSAIVDFNKTIELDNYKTVKTAFSYFFLGNKQKAIDIMNKRIEAAKNKNDNSLKGEYYNLACLYSLMYNEGEAIKYLNLALQNGYDNYDWLKKDTDFNNIKYKQSFKQLLEKYGIP